MSILQLTINGTLIAPEHLEYLKLRSSIFSTYSSAEIVIKDVTSMYVSNIGTGVPVIITVASGGNPIQTTMRVLDIDKEPIGGITLSYRVRIKAVSAWYFKNTLTDAVRGTKGTTVSDIVHEVISSEFADFVKPSIDQSEDRPSVRYQVGERSQEFLERVSKYAMSKQFPAYLFTDFYDRACFRGVGDIYAQTPSKCLVFADDSQPSVLKGLPAGLKVLTYSLFNIQNNLAQAHSISQFKFTTDNFLASEKLLTTATFKSAELFLNETVYPTPPSIRYLNWNKTPADALAIAARTAFEESCNAHNITVEFTGLDTSILPSSVFLLKLPTSDTTSQVNLKKYFAASVALELRENQYSTRILLMPCMMV